MTRIAPLLALTLALLGLMGQDTAPAHHSSALLLALLAVAHWRFDRPWRLRVWLLAPLLLVQLLAMASYLLPEYWLSIAHWNAWLSPLPEALGDSTNAYHWRPPALMVLSLGLLTVSLLINLRLALGAPLLLALAGLTLLTQALDQQWATSIWVLDHAATPLLLAAAGCLLVAQASLLIQRRRQQLPRLRRPLLAGLTLSLVALLFWHQQTTLEDRRQFHASADQSRALAEDFERENADHLAAMRRFVSFWELYDTPPSEAAWARQASRYHRDYRYFLNIAFIVPSSEITRVYPLQGNENALGARLFDDQPEGRAALSEALIHGREGSTGTIDLLQGVPGIIHYLPVRNTRNEILGATAMVVSLPALLDTLFNAIDTRAQALRLHAGEQLLASVGTLDDRVAWRHRFTIDVGGQPLQLDALPGRTTLLMQRARLPEVGLLVGLTFAYLLYMVLFAYQRLANQHRAAHHANQELRREVQARSVLQREVEWLARHDDLTKLPNRRLFMETLDTHAEQRPLSVMICDVDHFKRINDHLGHLTGDRYLRHLGEIGRRVITERDGLFARYGGEEFVACLPGIDAEQAERLAERLRLAITAADLHHHDGQRLSVSIGIATQFHGELDIGQLMQVADEALYDAKATGRNRVVSGRALVTPGDPSSQLSPR
ncbi:diguanylate cyclase (GGDEF) domain-containing protein [Franzmannia pantelleriensis]|uniref:diguanylate cyclase n=1 Tax=Franzmannia pantelleriensis TaxID=48727 RepID=A0A1G9PF20_9GAMM|nr:diguanylate cyclase [Halomonas pantelleriensis]SDL97452.1 diguanylate cyclase (GGDEF) domain-containing protein [Halomonas pantelleriensis]